MHAIMNLVPAVFEKHDQEAFEIFAYSVDTLPDDFTEYARRTPSREVSQTSAVTWLGSVAALEERFCFTATACFYAGSTELVVRVRLCFVRP